MNNRTFLKNIIKKPTQLLKLVLATTFPLFACVFVYGQSKALHIPGLEKGDTSLWFKWKQSDIEKIGLLDLTKSTEPLHFRFWEENAVVDIWSVSNSQFKGTLSFFTTNVTEGTKIDQKYFSKKTTLDTSTARFVYSLFSGNSIFQIPSDDSIEGWVVGLDGEELMIEYSTASFYSFKEYWTPSFSKEVKEAVTIEKVRKLLDTTLNIKKHWDEFLNGLPSGCYHYGELLIACNEQTKKDLEKLKGNKRGN